MKVLSPRDFARVIGVSESSVKRWIDDGTIPASRTVGGHRRIEREEAIRFIRRTRSPVLRPELLGLEDLRALAGKTASAPSSELHDALVDGRDAEARGLILSLYLGGRGVAAIGDGPVREALDRIGRLWLDREDGVFIEHRAVDICIQALTQLRLTFEPPEEAPLAIGAAVSGDPYLLPSMIASTVLQEVGFQTMNLGPETPIATLRHALSTHEPRLCWLSVSAVDDPKARAREIRDLASWLATRGVSGVLGGRSVDRLDLGPDILERADTMAELAAFARGLLGAS